MSVRDAVPGDWEALSALLAQLGPPHRVRPGPAGRTDFASVLSHSGTSVFVAEAAQGVVGSVTLHLLPNVTYGGRPYGLIENMITDEAHRGTGIGRRLMAAAMSRAWDARAYKIMLLTGQSRSARGFYEKLGFSADEKWGMIIRRV